MKLAVEAPGPLNVRTEPIADPGDLPARLPHPTALAWVHHGEGIVGWGETARITIPGGQDRFTHADQCLRHLFADATIDDPVDQPGTGPVAFGSFTFDPESSDSVLIIPRHILGRRNGQAWLTTIGTHPHTGDPLTLAHPPTPPTHLRWSDGTLTAPAWQQAVATAVDRIRHGHLGKTVLARDLTVQAAEPIDTRVLLARLATRYPACFTFAVDGLIGATPELLIRRTGDHIDSLVLAGTTPRGATPTDDHTRAQHLYHSTKDRQEHAYAADMVRDALTPLCTDLHVPHQPEILTLPNVIHLASPVHGTLDRQRSVLDVLAALHPTPAVCGTPTTPALNLIRELEVMDRGRYAGPVGWIDAHGDGEWGIALRCAELDKTDPTRARLFAGCGIVADSDPATELAEAQAKFRPMQEALQG
ncbi:isochorismate synthase [Thermomonospora echinospora]|uniref:isochorismate synthase n=1 Tax=Thermomonospora echinospora TaxID=1992 RepID=A0A1H6DA97_9ACTN|nr:isochorismate synthase [Thermomonospora echinospora]SEG81615.1 isochorismate synthase [Thermomonospora echinospora]